MTNRSWIVVVVVLAACSKDDKPAKPPEPASASAADASPAPAPPPTPVATKPIDAGSVAVATPDAAAALSDGGVDLTGRPKVKVEPDKMITAELLDQVYAQMASCPLVWSGFNSDTCPEAAVLQAATWGAGDGQRPEDYAVWDKMRSDAAMKKLADPSASVRYAAASYLLLTNTEDARAAVAAVIAKEQDPKVLQSYAVMMGNASTMHPALGDQLVRLADHEDKDVRTAVFEHGGFQGLTKAYEVTVKHCETETDAFTRGLACKDLGEMGDPRSYDELVKVMGTATDGNLWDDCFQGLVRLWTYYGNASAPAYKKTLELLAKGPHPAGAQLLALSELGSIPDAMKNGGDDWKAKKFIKLPEIQKALVAFATNKKEEVSGRRTAVDTLAQFGASKSVLKTIRKSVAAKPAPDSDEAYLANAMDEAISNAK
jgi:hypothetical protein